MFLTKKLTTAIVGVSGLLLMGCQSVPKDHTLKLTYSFSDINTDNRLDKYNGGITTSYPLILHGDGSQISVNCGRTASIPLTRCDEKRKICEHGFFHAKASCQINTSDIDANGKIPVTGKYTYWVTNDSDYRHEIKDGRLHSINHIHQEYADGFLLLPEVQETVSFIGVTGNGEVINVHVPFKYGADLSYKVSILIN